MIANSAAASARMMISSSQKGRPFTRKARPAAPIRLLTTIEGITPVATVKI